ncbi:MAG: hypothetical protein ACXWJ4_07385 [Methyloceanibacter sp.]
MTGERSWHVTLPLLVAAAAFAASALSLPLAPMMLALTVAAIGIYGAIGTFWSLPTTLLTGTAAAAGLALINSMGNAGGLVGPFVVGVMKDATGTFTTGLLFLAGTLAVGGGVDIFFSAMTPRRLHANGPRPRRPARKRQGGTDSRLGC